MPFAVQTVEAIANGWRHAPKPMTDINVTTTYGLVKDVLDVSAAAVGHVDIDIMCTRTVVGVGVTSMSSGWVCRRSAYGEMTRSFIYHDGNLTTRLEHKP